MWGQGLKEEHKFYTFIKQDIEKIYKNTKVNIEVFAHSGAIIGVRDQNIQPRKHGEIPSSYPTILQQVKDYPIDNAENIDLVLIDGGINDIGFSKIIFAPHVGLNEKIREVFGSHLKILLMDVLSKFSSSRTKIMVTGYYRIVSRYSDFGLLNKWGSILKIIPGDPLALKTLAVAGSKLFYDNSVALSTQVIRDLDPAGLKIYYYSLNLDDAIAVMTSGSYLWGQQPFIGSAYSDDEVIAERKKLCEQEQMDEDLHSQCVNAGIGHPNYRNFNGGARSYYYGIISKLFPTPKSCQGLEYEYETLLIEIKRLQNELQTFADKPKKVADIIEASKASEAILSLLIKCKNSYYNNNGILNVGNVLEIIRKRGWTLKPISIRQVVDTLGLVRPVSLRHI